MKIKVNIQSCIGYTLTYNNISLAFGFVLYFGRLLCWSGGVAFRLPCIYLENFNMGKNITLSVPGSDDVLFELRCRKNAS